jgi:hypothetical protein
VLAASIIGAMMMEAASTSETSVNSYQNTVLQPRRQPPFTIYVTNLDTIRVKLQEAEYRYTVIYEVAALLRNTA